MKLQLRYFASVREALGRSEESVQTNAPTLGALRDELIALGEPHATALARGRALRMALNHEMRDEDTPLPADAQEVAFFPPVTGG